MEQEKQEVVSDQSGANEISSNSSEIEVDIKAKVPGWVKFLLFISLSASCAAAIGIFVFLSQQQQNQQQYGAQLTSVQDEMQANKYLIAAKDKELGALKNRLANVIGDSAAQGQQMQGKFNNMQDLLARQDVQLQSIASADPTDWLLAEIEYLLRMANQRLLMSGDVDGARMLLTAADTIIQELDDSALLSVRQSLAEDLAVLAAVKKIDQEGIFVRLETLSKMLDELPLIEGLGNKTTELITVPITESVKVDFKTSNESDSELVKLKTLFFNGFKDVMDMFDIRYHDYSIEPLLPPNQHFYLTQNIHLMFNQAKSALLSNQQSVYSSSLGNAREWLRKYFQLSSVTIKPVLTGIDELLALNIAQSLPDISRSLGSLKKYKEKKHKLLSMVAINSEINSEKGADQNLEAKPREEAQLINPSTEISATVSSAASSAVLSTVSSDKTGEL